MKLSLIQITTSQKIVSYFPFSESEKQEILLILKRRSFDGFSSIFVDGVSASEWEKTKDQIKKKFNDELFDIDKKKTKFFLVMDLLYYPENSRLDARLAKW